MIFKDPWILLLIPVIVLLLVFIKRRQQSASLRFPSTDLLAGIGQTWRTQLIGLPFILRIAAIALVLVALAGPRSVLEETEHKSEGIDIVLALDASSSMLAEDFTINGKRLNRLEVVKRVVEDFIDGRQSDRIGLIAFGGLAYTVSPLTVDYAWLKENLKRVEIGLLKDGTAIGSAIASSVSRLRQSKVKSKVIVLLTDGMSNAGKIDPLTAAQAAKILGIKIYTIGAGAKGFAPFPVQDFFGRTIYQKVQVDIDEETLKKIADLTSGKYFRATDTDSLREIFKAIDHLEKTEIETLNYKEYKEFFWQFLVAALMILFLELILSNTILLRIP